MSDRQNRPVDRGPERGSAPRLPTSQKTEKTAATEADPESGWHNADGTPYEGDLPPARESGPGTDSR